MKKVLIIINIGKDISMNLAEEIKEYLQTKDCQIDFVDFDGFTENVKFEGYDFAITLGGDGTVLFAARNCVENDIPVFPVNLGQFGFIASVQPDDWKKELDDYLNGNAVINQRSMMKISVIRKDKTIYTSSALNDVVICASRAATTISLDVKYNNQPLCKLKSDGVIVSTPTGSTAYSAAAGGPIVDPELEAFVFTPVNSFSLSSRPLVLSPKGKLNISICQSRTKSIQIAVDGQEPFILETDDNVLIENLGKSIKLISSTQEKFYNALRSKLNWSGVPHA